MALTDKNKKEFEIALNRTRTGESKPGSTDFQNLQYASDKYGYVPPYRKPASSSSGAAGSADGSGSSANKANTDQSGIYSNSGLTPTNTPYMGDTDYTADSYEDIRQRTLDEMQTQIDAVNSYYNSLASQEIEYGRDREGRTRAGSARGGLLGSSFGAMREDKTQAYNQKQQSAIAADRSMQLSAVYERLDKRADERYDAEVSRARGAVDDYNDWLDKTKKSTREDLAVLAATGVDIQDPDDYKEWAELGGFGYNEETGQSLMLDAWMNYNKPKEEQVEYKYMEAKDGTMVRTGSDGSYSEMGNYAPPDETAGWSVMEVGGVPQWVKMGADGTIFETGGSVSEGIGKDDFTLGKARYSYNTEAGQYEIIAGSAGNGSGTPSLNDLFDADDRKILYSTGVSDTELKDLIAGVNSTGLSIREILTEAGKSEEQIKTIEDVFSGGQDLDTIEQKLDIEKKEIDVDNSTKTFNEKINDAMAGYTVEDMKAVLKANDIDLRFGFDSKAKDEQVKAKFKEYLIKKSK